METNEKFLAFREAIKKAIKEGNLQSKMDVLKLQAVELGINQEVLHAMIEEEKADAAKQNKMSDIIAKNKSMIIGICIAAVVIEWIIGLRGNVSFLSIIGLLVVNVITLLAIVFGFAYYLSKK